MNGKDIRFLVASSLACVIAIGCSRAETDGSAAGTSAPTTPAVDELPALPTVDETQQQAADEISEENVDDAMRRLEEELDADTGEDG